MAETALVKTTLLGAYGTYGANLADVTFAAADVGNKNKFTLTEGDVVIAWNTSGASAYTVTIESVTDPYGRERDITAYSIPLSSFAVFGPFEAVGWRGTGEVILSASNAAVKFAVLKQQ